MLVITRRAPRGTGSSLPNGEPHHLRQLAGLHTIASGKKLPTAIEGIGTLKHDASRWGRSVVLQATNGGTFRITRGCEPSRASGLLANIPRFCARHIPGYGCGRAISNWLMDSRPFTSLEKPVNENP